MGNKNIDGLFLDDFWSNFPYHLPWATNAARDCSLSPTGGPSEIKGGCIDEMGLGAQDVQDLATEWKKTMEAALAKIAAMQGYSWQMLQFPGGSQGPDPGDLTKPKPASFFRTECTANSTSAMTPIMMRFSSPTTKVGPTLGSFEQDLAAFLLIRSGYAWLGYSWAGCNRQYSRPPMLDSDFGVPQDGQRCKETETGVFNREYTKASIQLDTNTNKATITMKSDDGRMDTGGAGPPLTYASPRNVTFVRTLFNDTVFGYRDPTAPVYDGEYWHIWATRVPGTEAGYAGVVWHLYAKELDSDWRDGGIAINRSSHGTASKVGWDSYGVFTPSVAWEGASGAIVPAPEAKTWFMFFGGVSHTQPAYDEAIGIATANSPFGPWTKSLANPIITGRSPVNVEWCDPDGPGTSPGILHVDEAEPYVLQGQRRLYVKTICRNHTVLPSVYRPIDPTSWHPPYEYATIRQPVIPPTVTPSGRGFEQARIFLGPDRRLHMTATAYDGFNPHFVSVDNNSGNEWALVEKIRGWGEPIHELTPVGPAGAGPPGVGGVPGFFIQFAGSPFQINLLAVHWQNDTSFPPSPPAPVPQHHTSYTVVGAGSSEWNGVFRQQRGTSNRIFQQEANGSHTLYTEASQARGRVVTGGHGGCER